MGKKMNCELPAGFRKVKHDLLDKKDAGSIWVIGDAVTATEVLYFQPGFPDTQWAFVPLAKEIVEASQGRFLAGIGCMPEFDRVAGVAGAEKTQALKPEGYNMEEITRCFAQSVDALLEEKRSKNAIAKLTIIAHDWGSMAATCYANTHSEKVDRVILFDVLPPGVRDQPPLWTKFVHTFYMFMFAYGFFLYRLVGDSRIGQAIGFCLGKIWLVITAILCFNPIMTPAGPLDSSSLSITSTPPYQLYPYYKIHVDVFANKPFLKNLSLKSLLERVPLLYIYGENKNTFWHTDGALEQISRDAQASLA